MYHHEQNFGRDMNVKGVSGDALEEKDEPIIDKPKSVLSSGKNLG